MQYCSTCGQDVGDAPRDAHAALRARLAHILDGRYRVRDVLGEGGMGVVFLADDLIGDRVVAIKVLTPDLSRDDNVVSRFQREASTAARLDHPGIIPTYGVESHGGLHYIVMKYVAGQSLEDVLRAESKVSIAFATRILRQAAAALAHAHRHGVVHRDVKPDNIMLDEQGHVLIADFGISKVSTASTGATTVARLTEVGGVIGTPHYMSPEHALGQEVDGRADQYSLGVVGFQMLTGTLPFDDETPHAIVHLHISEAPPPIVKLRPDVPPHLAAAISRAMSKAPANRFATMEEFAAAVLGETDEDLDLALDRAFTAPRPARAGGTASSLAAAALILAGLGVTAAWVGGVGRNSKTSPTATATAKATRRRTTTPPPPPPTRSEPRRTTTPATPAKSEPRRTVASATTPKTERARTVALSIASKPRSTIFIDGRRIGDTPLSDHKLTVGRTYKIRLERKGYRTKRETITATGTRTIRRSYTLARDSRR